MLRGASTLADAARGTLGLKARAVVLERAYGAPLVFNSGIAAAKEMELPDRFENPGARPIPLARSIGDAREDAWKRTLDDHSRKEDNLLRVRWRR